MDHNDCKPVFNQSHYYASIAENVTVGTSLLRVSATDNDQGDNGLVTYSIHSQDSHFGIEKKTGWMFITKPLDFESKEVHELVVIARDSGAQPLETSAFVSIQVTDVNDNQPTIGLLYLTENARPEIKENAKVGDLVARVSVNDADLTDSKANAESGHSPSVSLSGGDGRFGLTSQNNGSIHLIVVTGPLVREKKARYNLTVIVTDQGSPPLNTSTNFELEIVSSHMMATQPPSHSLNTTTTSELETSSEQMLTTQGSLALNISTTSKIEINSDNIVNRGSEPGEVIKSGDIQSTPANNSMSVPGWVLFLIVLLMLITVVLSISIVVIRLNQHQQQQHMMGDHVRHIGPHNIGSLLRKIGPGYLSMSTLIRVLFRRECLRIILNTYKTYSHLIEWNFQL